MVTTDKIHPAITAVLANLSLSSTRSKELGNGVIPIGDGSK